MGILPLRLRGIGILPMMHGLEAHATSTQRSHEIALSGPGKQLTTTGAKMVY